MAGDWLQDGLESVEAAAKRALRDLEHVLEHVEVLRSAGRRGIEPTTVARQESQRGRELRLAADASFASFQQANAALRMAMVKAMVDDDKMSFTDAGAVLGVSRTMASRLYRGVYADGKQIGPKVPGDGDGDGSRGTPGRVASVDLPHPAT